MGILGKDGAEYNNANELIKANSRWEQQERQNKLLEEQNTLKKKEMEIQENQRKAEFAKQMELEKEKIYEESRKADAIEAQTKAIEEQNKIALMTDEEKAIYKEQKVKEEYVTTLEDKVYSSLSDAEALMRLINTADDVYLEQYEKDNSKQMAKLQYYKARQAELSNKKKVKMITISSLGFIYMMCITLLVVFIWMIIENPAFISTAVPFIIISIVIMIGGTKWIKSYYSTDYSKKIEDLQAKMQLSIMPEYKVLPTFNRWITSKAISDVDAYRQYIIKYLLELQDTVKQWKNTCIKNDERMHEVGTDLFDRFIEETTAIIGILKD